MKTIKGRKLYTLQAGVDNDGTYSGRNGSGFQLGIYTITQHMPQHPGRLQRKTTKFLYVFLFQ